MEEWGNLLKRLRESNEHALFALLSNCDDIDFAPNATTIYVATKAEYNLLTNNVDKLGGGIIIREKQKKADNNQYTDTLYEMFGDKLIIE